MQETVFSTQLFFETTKRNEPPEAFFRRFQKKLWEWIPELLSDSDLPESKHAILERLPFEDFSENEECAFGRNGFTAVEWRNLKTGKVLIQGVKFRLRLPSHKVPSQSDRTLVTDICIESPREVGSLNTGIRFSFATFVEYQPFAGFFPRPKLPLVTPGLLEELGKLQNTRISFFPKVHNVEEHRRALRYPISRTPIIVDDETSGREFIKRIRAPFRPVCFVVYFGDMRANRAEAAQMAELLWTKAYVYVVKKLPSIMSALAETVPGFSQPGSIGRVCRVFFPFGGQYLQDDFANPSYSMVSLVGDYDREDILTGLFRYFDMNESGWRRNVRDVARTFMEVQRVRRFEVMEKEQGKKEKAISRLNNEMKNERKVREKVEIECEKQLEQCRLEVDLLQENNLELSMAHDADQHEIARLQSEMGRLERQCAELVEEAGKKRPIPRELLANLKTLKEWCGLLPCLEIAERAGDGMKGRENNLRFIEDVWDKLWALNEFYFTIFKQDKGVDPRSLFKEKTGYGIAFKEEEAVMCKKEWAAERTFSHKGDRLECWAHVKGGTGKNKDVTRVYFVQPKPNDSTIIVGWIGSHLTTTQSKAVR